MNELTTVDDQEDEDDDDVIPLEDVQPAAMSPFEALSDLDLFFRSTDKHEDALHSLVRILQQALNIAVTKPKQKNQQVFRANVTVYGV